MKVLDLAKQFWKVASVIFLVGFVAFFVYDYAVNEPVAAAVNRDLEQEFKDVVPPPGVTSCNYRSSHKPQQALVGDSYGSKLSFAEIRSYYDTELSKHGWHFQREESMRDWGRDLGGKSVRYCKGNYTATLNYAGENAENGWDFALDLSWGLGSTLERWRGALCQ